MRILFRFAGLTLALLLVAGSVVRAQDITVHVGSVNPSNTSYITYDDSVNNGNHTTPPTSTENVYVGPFTGSSTSGTGAIPVLNGGLFCVDLWHDQNQSTTNLSTVGSTANLAATFPSGVPSATNLVNDLNYLGYVYNTLYHGGNNSTAMAALQMSIWQLVDTRLTYTNTGLSTDVGLITLLLRGATTETVEGVKLLGYGQTGTMGYTAEVLYVDRVKSSGQNLLTWCVPEPSSMAIAGLGALGMIGYGLRRRKSS